MSFVHLHIHSEFSLLRSAAKLDDLAARAKALGYTALALTDIDAMYGIIPFWKACRKHGIHPVLGVELAYAADHPSATEKITSRIIFLAENNEGYKSILKLTSKAHEKNGRHGPYVTVSEMQELTQGIIAIVPFEEGAVQRFIAEGEIEKARKHFKWLQHTYQKENVFLEIQNHWRRSEREKLHKISRWVREEDIPVVASNHVHFLTPEQADAHKVIQAVRLGLKLDELPDEMSSAEYYLKSRDEMEDLFKAWPEAVKETERIAFRCNAEPELGGSVLPEFPLPEGKTAGEYLREQCEKGVAERFGQPADEVWQRLDFELKVIDQMGYNDYFLIVADFMNYAHRQGILTGPGRGSAAGSLTAYVLKITDIDPLKYGLLFERFLNPERVSMPDIDIDFPDNRRDEVIHYVKEKYGKNHVAQIITFGTLAAKAAIRDAGRVLGIDSGTIDKVAKNMPSRPNLKLNAAVEESQALSRMIEENDELKELFRIAGDIEGLPRHSSVHAAGIVMSSQPLTDTVPLQEGHEGMSLTQFPMGDLEELGLLKMDFLGLRNLSFLERVIKMVQLTRGETIRLEELSFNDPDTFKLLGRGETNGVFQLESSGMKNVLRKLKPTEFEDIVAVNALYRPGPMENIPMYIKRKHGKEQVSYPHPALKKILEPTYGVLIYQEQIMQIAAEMAGFSLGEADILRRAVGKKKQKDLEETRARFTEGAIRKGFSTEEAGEMYNTILRFANYGFNRSHAVAYSIIAYYLAYIKANYPLEFMAGLMGTVIHHQDKLAEYIAEAKHQGVTVHPPSISHSEGQFSVKDGEIWIGLAAIKNVGIQSVQEIIKERKKRPFTSLFDLCERIPPRILPKRSLEALIAAGALDSLLVDRARLLASADDAIEYGEKQREMKEGGQTALFFEEEKEPEYINVPPLSDKDKLNFEKQVLGFYASGHPIEAELPTLSQYSRETIIDAKEGAGKSRKLRIAGMAEEVRIIQTKKKEQMAFIKMSDETGEIDITVFPSAFREHRHKLQKGELLFLEGTLQDHQGDIKFILDKCTAVSALKKKKEQEKKPVLYLKIPAVYEKKEHLDRLKSLLQDAPGEIPVILFYERTNKALHLSEIWNVTDSEKLLNALKGILGQKNVYLKRQAM
ncbi:DNA polymerase III subunit alpha [Evansella clarkii]|uniref:DNA polymerase III subunit alpha n=1 Tax=Evansella clarkii TaxID=79879 RepID=UPI001474768A|nr:DNA polymerase III subunit alpha [Evansella clarkii]